MTKRSLRGEPEWGWQGGDEGKVQDPKRGRLRLSLGYLYLGGEFWS